MLKKATADFKFVQISLENKRRMKRAQFVLAIHFRHFCFGVTQSSRRSSFECYGCYAVFCHFHLSSSFCQSSSVSFLFIFRDHSAFIERRSAILCLRTRIWLDTTILDMPRPCAIIFAIEKYLSRGNLSRCPIAFELIFC